MDDLTLESGGRELAIRPLASGTLSVNLRTPTKQIGMRLNPYAENKLRNYLNERHREREARRAVA